MRITSRSRKCRACAQIPYARTPSKKTNGNVDTGVHRQPSTVRIHGYCNCKFHRATMSLHYYVALFLHTLIAACLAAGVTKWTRREWGSSSVDSTELPCIVSPPGRPPSCCTLHCTLHCISARSPTLLLYLALYLALYLRQVAHPPAVWN